MPTRIKVSEKLATKARYGGNDELDKDDIIYKPLIMVTLSDGNNYSFTYNMSNDTLAYTVNYSEIRYTRVPEYTLKHKVEAIVKANYD